MKKYHSKRGTATVNAKNTCRIRRKLPHSGKNDAACIRIEKKRTRLDGFAKVKVGKRKAITPYKEERKDHGLVLL